MCSVYPADTCHTTAWRHTSVSHWSGGDRDLPGVAPRQSAQAWLQDKGTYHSASILEPAK